jgi:nucleoside-triphosphatase THEP1
MDLETEEKVLFAKRKDPDGDETSGLTNFFFNPAAFDWARLKLVSAMANPRKPIILDEIGPLEIESGEGFASIIRELLYTFKGSLVLTVRPSLLSTFKKIFLGPKTPKWNIKRIDILGFEEIANNAIPTAKSIFYHCQQQE